MTTGIALEAATLFAFSCATGGHVALNPLLSATTSIFVDGTKSITGNEDGISPYRMVDSFRGTYDQTTGPDNAQTAVGSPNEFVSYPRSLGALTGLGDPTYDASEGVATAETVKAVRAAAADPAFDRETDTIFVVGYSQGAGGVVNAIPALEVDPELSGVDIQYVLAANPRRNDGGILTRLPPGVYVPVVGVTFGGGTTTQTSNVLQVTKQYDGVGDAPKYVFNVVADANAVLGFIYLHPDYYKDVDPTTELDPVTNLPRTDRIITHSADGTVTDVLIKAPLGELPLTMPLLQLGVPRSIIEALDPFLRAIIETGYDRPAVVPSQAVPFQLVPPPAKWLSDLQSVTAGAVRTGQAISGTGTPPAPAAPFNGAANGRLSTLVADEPEPFGVDQKPLLDDTAPLAVADSPIPNPRPTLTTPPTPIKFEPPRQPSGGWKPGDLLRSIFNPKPKPSVGSSNGGVSSTPDAPSPPAPPSGDPQNSDAKDTAQAPAA